VERLLSQPAWIDQVADAVQPVVNNLFNNTGEVGRTAKDFLNGVWLGHNLHPVITDVPIGTWTLAQILDVVSASRGDDATLDAAADLALGTGIVAAVAAAVTGITDWSEVGGIQRRAGLVHGLLNAAGLTLNVGSLAIRMSGGNRGTARALSGTAFTISTMAAYIGGDLVYKLGQAVDRQAWVEGPEDFTDLAAVDDLDDGKMHNYELDGKSIVLVRHDDGIHAFNGICPHFGGPLWEGELKDHCVTCPWHGSQFDISDGSLLHGPSTYPVHRYEVHVQGGRVLVKLEGYE